MNPSNREGNRRDPDSGPELDRLVEGFRSGDPGALARAISMVEDARPGLPALFAALPRPKGSRARRVGITGPPGAGKSSLVGELVQRIRRRDGTVGVLAMDPSSAFTGGAVLGDRIRMGRLASDPGVFIRSSASRGELGGLSGEAFEVLDLMDTFGFTDLLAETVGVGQSELGIATVVDTVVVVLVPESGDAVQAMKAGLSEIADVFVVNKADRPGAEDLARELKGAVALRSEASGTSHTPARGGWLPPVVLTAAHHGEGVDALLQVLDLHRSHLEESGELGARRRDRVTTRLRELLEREARRWIARTVLEGDGTKRLVDRILEGRSTVPEIAEELLARFARSSGSDPGDRGHEDEAD